MHTTEVTTWFLQFSAQSPLKNYQQAGFVITLIEHSTEALPQLNDSRFWRQILFIQR